MVSSNELLLPVDFLICVHRFVHIIPLLSFNVHGICSDVYFFIFNLFSSLSSLLPSSFLLTISISFLSLQYWGFIPPGLTHARHALFHWATVPALLKSFILKKGLANFLRLALNPCLSLQTTWNYRHVHNTLLLLFLVNLVKELSTLLIFLKNCLLVLLIFSTDFLFSISMICALIFFLLLNLGFYLLFLLLVSYFF